MKQQNGISFIILNKFGYPKHDAADGGPLAKKGNGLSYFRTDGRTHPLIEMLGRI